MLYLRQEWISMTKVCAVWCLPVVNWQLSLHQFRRCCQQRCASCNALKYVDITLILSAY